LGREASLSSDIAAVPEIPSALAGLAPREAERVHRASFGEDRNFDVAQEFELPHQAVASANQAVAAGPAPYGERSNAHRKA
jgi:hypothetical protein